MSSIIDAPPVLAMLIAGVFVGIPFGIALERVQKKTYKGYLDAATIIVSMMAASSAIFISTNGFNIVNIVMLSIALYLYAFHRPTLALGMMLAREK